MWYMDEDQFLQKQSPSDWHERCEIGHQGRELMTTSRSVLSASGFALVLLVTGCASKQLAGDPGPAEAPKPAEASHSHAGEVAKGALKGAGRGAYVCAMPTAVGLQGGGPIGLAIGGIITLYCLPFGIVAGAVIGGISNAAPISQSAALPGVN
jgi:hypothetical protein